jgi:hypothetical protein
MLQKALHMTDLILPGQAGAFKPPTQIPYDELIRRDVQVNIALFINDRINGKSVALLGRPREWCDDHEVCQFSFEIPNKFVPMSENKWRESLKIMTEKLLERARSAGMVKP